MLLFLQLCILLILLSALCRRFGLGLFGLLDRLAPRLNFLQQFFLLLPELARRSLRFLDLILVRVVVGRLIFRVCLFVRSRSALLILASVLSLRLYVSGTGITEQLILALALIRLVTLPDVLAFSGRLRLLLQDFGSLLSIFVLLLHSGVLRRAWYLLDSICLLFLGFIFVFHHQQ